MITTGHMDPFLLSANKEQETSTAKCLSEDEGDGLYPKRPMKSHLGKNAQKQCGTAGSTHRWEIKHTPLSIHAQPGRRNSELILAQQVLTTNRKGAKGAYTWRVCWFPRY